MPKRMPEDFGRFLSTEVVGAIVLLAATVIALVFANSPLHVAYEAFWETSVGIAIGDHGFSMPLVDLVNDALMALFFLVVGLEIKREILVGELSARRKAALPLLAAIGGMAVPALVYLALNYGGAGESGWGIPMATDIAFAVGVMALLGSRVPQGLKVFLVSLAIVDDIGAILIIAVAYTADLSVLWLAFAVLLLVALVLLNRLSVDHPAPYLIVGVLMWFCVLLSGVHSTIAGVMLAFAIPSTAKLDPLSFARQTREDCSEIESHHVRGEHVLENDRQQIVARRIRRAAHHTSAPLQRLEFALHPWTTFLVLPLFALANAGVRFVDASLTDLFATPIALGVTLGLLLGKPFGIVLATWLAERFHLVELPSGTGWRHIIGAGILGGIGFTMSIFISGLAFSDASQVNEAKAAIMIASVVAGYAGYLVLRSVCKDRAR
ncbi:MAG: Na+/H+ antiporter NhaA [Coriobacteriia bacterium]|nr:Na+/H+ antiporter NhaA [Coriobacteriia bacterium]